MKRFFTFPALVFVVALALIAFSALELYLLVWLRCRAVPEGCARVAERPSRLAPVLCSWLSDGDNVGEVAPVCE
jgi:hypothetical protein